MTTVAQSRQTAAVIGAGAAVTVALVGFGLLHRPWGYVWPGGGFVPWAGVKSTLASIVLVLVVAQVITAAGLWGRLPRVVQPASEVGRARLARVHRWTGRVSVLVSLPVAFLCLVAAGFELSSPATIAHSSLGCLFYGVFAAKMLALSRPGLPALTIPLLGSAVALAMLGLWLTSAFLFFLVSLAGG